MTPDDLQSLLSECRKALELDEKATRSPWHVGAQNDALFIVIGQPPSPGNDHPNHEASRVPLAKVYDDPNCDSNAQLIAHARTHSPRASRAVLELMEENERLDHAYKDYRVAVGRLRIECSQLHIERDAANTRVKELEADKERLDWLEANGHRVGVACWKGEGAESNPWTIHEEFPDKMIAEENTLRSAIDAARQQEEKK